MREPSLSDLTFESAALEWLRETKKRVKESSYTRYHRNITVYLIPYLKDTLIRDIDNEMLQRITESLKTDGGVRGNGLSTKTVSDITSLLITIVKDIREQNGEAVYLKKEKKTKVLRRQFVVLEDEERIKLEQRLLNEEEITGIGILLALYTGLRIGELCGLRWEDVDAESHTITIRRTVERITDLSGETVRKTKVVVIEPKTVTSNRIIPCPSVFIRLLKPYLGPPGVYILSGAQKPSEPHSVYMRYTRILQACGIRHYSFHALRHTFATRCMAEGCDVKMLSELLGHSNVNTTLSVYVHPTMNQKRTQIEKLGEGLQQQIKAAKGMKGHTGAA